ncbi:hypothetical protein [Actinokineospora sp. UTMC 2448]|uniref:hypothetical protein n=1 Tax=Actinokineospora sp. UTMC 2448 TaxID=2268449 RepID=UPI002164658C|nr:hypothetical protein [Actinokineospora sp. UTMC 2448]
MSVIGRGFDSLEVEWSGGPLLTTVLTAFSHPVTQIVSGQFTSHAWRDSDLAEIKDHNTPPRTAGQRAFKNGSLLLQRLRATEPHPATSGSGLMADVWQVWESAYVPSTGKLRARHQFDELVALRCTYTGESQTSASRIVKGLSQDALPNRDAGWLIPEAHSVHQRVLETSLLLAIRDADAPVGDHHLLQHQVYRTVSPRRRRLVVEVEHRLARKLLRSLLSSQLPNPSGSGVPGLRVKQGHNGIALTLLDRNGELTDAEVEIKNITMTHWDRFWADIDSAVAPEHRRVDPRLDRSPRLSPGEHQDFDYHRRSCGPVGLGSAMLRRIGLLAGASAVDVWAGLGKTEIHIEIHDGPPVHRVVKALRHLHAGLDPDLVIFDENDSSFCRVSDRITAADRFTGDPKRMHSRPSLVFRPLNWRDQRQS